MVSLSRVAGGGGGTTYQAVSNAKYYVPFEKAGTISQRVVKKIRKNYTSQVTK